MLHSAYVRITDIMMHHSISQLRGKNVNINLHKNIRVVHELWLVLFFFCFFNSVSLPYFSLCHSWHKKKWHLGDVFMSCASYYHFNSMILHYFQIVKALLNCWKTSTENFSHGPCWDKLIQDSFQSKQSFSKELCCVEVRWIKTLKQSDSERVREASIFSEEEGRKQ